jgi:hypothetical protein
MRYGFWLPVFGGWLRNIDDEQMPATWGYVRAHSISDVVLVSMISVDRQKDPAQKLLKEQSA